MKYIGLDAHSRTCFFAVLGKSGKVLKTERINTSESEILKFVRSIKGKKKLVVEEGVISHWIYLLLKDEVERLLVCQPNDKKGPKNDRIDAVENADLLRVNRLKTVFHDDHVFMELRVAVSGYNDITSEIVRNKNRYKALFRQVAIPTQGKAFYQSPETISQLPTPTQQHVAGSLYHHIQFLEHQKSQYHELFLANVRKYKSIRLLTTIPGIKAVRSNQIMAIVVTPYRFPTKYNFFAYARLTNHMRESDGKIYGKKRANNNSLLKGIFKSAAQDAIRTDNSFRRKYQQMMARGADHRKAKNAVCKMLAATVLGVLKSGKKYNDKQREVMQGKHQPDHIIV